MTNYFRNPDEEIITLMLRSPKLYSTFGEYIAPKLFDSTAAKLLFEVIQRTPDPTEFQLLESVNALKLGSEAERKEIRAVLDRAHRYPGQIGEAEGFQAIQEWATLALWTNYAGEPFSKENIDRIMQLSTLSLADDLFTPESHDPVALWTKLEESAKGVPYLFPQMGEIPLGEVGVIAGFSHTGKSLLLLKTAIESARRGFLVLMMDLENVAASTRRNFLRCALRADRSEVAELVRCNSERLTDALVPNLHIWTPTVPDAYTASGIRRYLRAFVRQHGRSPDLIIFDQLGKIAAQGGRNSSPHTDGEYRISALIALAKEFNSAIVTAHHLNRESAREQKAGRKASALHSGQSQKIFDWADHFWVLEAPIDERDLDEETIKERNHIYVRLANSKFRNEQLKPTLFLQIDAARYKFAQINAVQYELKKLHITHVPPSEPAKQVEDRPRKPPKVQNSLVTERQNDLTRLFKD